MSVFGSGLHSHFTRPKELREKAYNKPGGANPTNITLNKLRQLKNLGVQGPTRAESPKDI